MIECKKVSFSYPSNESIDGEREVHGTLKNLSLIHISEPTRH